MVTDNYKAAIKIYKSLKCPKQYADLVLNEWLPNEDTWNVILSKRSKGKTTNALLWGLCLNKAYGIEIQYIRQHEKHIMPKFCGKLFDGINDNPKYIDILTDGKYNRIIKHPRARSWHYAKYEGLNLVEMCDAPIVQMLAIDKAMDVKSGYTATNGDYIIIDEFVTTEGYIYDEFGLLQQLLSTIIRQRDGVHIYLLGNTIDPHCVYFKELEITDIIPTLQYNDHRHLKCIDDVTGVATTLHVYMMPPPDEQHEKMNLHYFGWKTSSNVAITARGGVWALHNYQKPPKGDYRILTRRQIYHLHKYLTLEVRQSDDNGIYIAVYADELDENVITYTTDNCIYNARTRYGLGYTPVDKRISNIIGLNRVYFSDNSVGTLFVTYLKTISMKGN